MQGFAKLAAERGSVGLIDERFSLHDGEAAFEAAIDAETVKPVFDLDDLR